jgi:hypothetical protein
MSMFRGLWGSKVVYLGLAALLAACAGKAPTKSPSSGASAQQAVPGAVAAPGAAALDAVRVHLARPLHDLPVAGGLLAKPPVSDVLISPERFLWAFVGESAARAIDLSGPIDAAIGYDEPIRGAVAFRVREAEVAGLRGRELPGRLRQAPVEKVQLGHCELWRRPAPRMVCARDSASLDAFGAGLARLEPPASDASLVIEASGPAYERWMRESLEKEAAEAAGDESSAERSGREIADELLRAEKLTVELGIAPRGIELALVLGYTSKRQSPLLQRWLESGVSPKPLPNPHPGGNFWLAYAGSDVYAKLQDSLLDEFLADMAQNTDVSSQDLKDAREIIGKLLPETGRVAIASGSNVPAALTLLEKQGAASPVQRRKLDRALGGWWLVTLDTAPVEYLATVERALKLNERHMQDKPGKAPEKVRATSSKLSKSPAVPKLLPPGSLHLLDTVSPNKDFVPDAQHPAQDAHLNHFFVVPDSAHSRVIIAISRSEDVAAAQARAALDSSAVQAPAPGALLAMRATPAALRGMMASFDNAAESERTKAFLQSVLALPSQGQQDLQVTGTMRRLAGSQEGLELRVSFQLTTAAAAEWLQWAARGMDNSRKD